MDNHLDSFTDAELDLVAGGVAMSTSIHATKATGAIHANDVELPPDPVITAAETAVKVAGGALWALLF